MGQNLLYLIALVALLAMIYIFVKTGLDIKRIITDDTIKKIVDQIKEDNQKQLNRIRAQQITEIDKAKNELKEYVQKQSTKDLKHIVETVKELIK